MPLWPRCLFLAAHCALLAGVTTPGNLYFDEVHYVPAARQMLEPVLASPVFNPMHPPLAKQMMAASIRIFGDTPMGWRYPSVLSGSLAIVAIYLGGLALFAAQGPAIAAALLALLQPDAVRAVADRDAGCVLPRVRAAGMAAFLHGFRRERPHLLFLLAGLAFGFSIACKWSGLFVLADLHRHHRCDPADAGLAHAIRRCRCRRLVPARALAGLPPLSLRALLRCVPAIAYLVPFVALYGFSFSDIVEAQRRIFSDNTTTAIAGHPYMSSWPSWPFLVRPVWYLFDKIGNDRIAAVVFLGNPLMLWPALIALVVCLRDWIVTRRADAFLILAFYFGPYLAWALLPRTLGFMLLLSAGRDDCEFCAGLCPAARQQSALGVVGVRRHCRRGLRSHAADLGCVPRNVDGDLQPADAVPELDLNQPAVGRVSAMQSLPC